MSSAPLLSPHFVFGINSGVAGGLTYLDDQTILYSAGHNLIIYSIDTRQQRFIPLTDVNGAFGRTEITCIAVSHSRRFIAVGERSNDVGLISIFDLRSLKKRRILTCPDVRSREYVSLSFSSDSRLLLSLSGGPEYLSVAWDWQKAKPIQFASLNQNNSNSMAHQISFSHSSLDSQFSSPTSFPSLAASAAGSAGGGFIAVTGRNVLEIYSPTKENPLSGNDEKEKPADPESGESSAPVASLVGLAKFVVQPGVRPPVGDADILTHLWIRIPINSNDGLQRSKQLLLLGTGQGSLLAYENGQFQFSIPTQPPQNSQAAAPKQISALLANSNGFLAGCDNGLVLVYQFGSSGDIVLSRSLSSDLSSRVVQLSLSPNQENLLVMTENQQLLILKNFSTDALVTHREVHFNPLIGAFHSGPITGSSTCVRKPIIATCSSDRTIRIWNYLSRTLELSVQFPEPALAVSLHPSGLHLLVGFADKLRLMNLLMDDIRPYKEFPIKSCSECAFSNGGHLFAACHVGLIQVYNTYTAEQVAVFRGHTGTIKSLFWSADDTKIVSAGLDGAVYERRLNSTAMLSLASPGSTIASSSVRTQEHVQKGCKFSSALCTEDERIYAVGDDKMLKEIVDKNVNKTLDAGVVLTQLAVSHATPQRMLFAGTANGVVRSFAFPLTGVVKDYQAHCKSVSRLRLTSNDQILSSAGEDGILAIFRVRNDQNQSDDSVIDSSAFSEEVLVHRSDLEEKNSLMVELRSKVDELTASNEYQLRLHDMNYQEKLREVSEKYNAQLDHDRSRIEMLRDEKAELESECEEKLNSLKQSQASQLHAEDLAHQREIVRLVEIYQKTQQKIENEKEQKRRELAQLKANYASQLETLEEETQRAFLTETEATQEEKHLSNMIKREFDETRSQLENDFDREIESLREKYEKKLHQERDATLRLKGENGIMNKKFASLEKEIADQEESVAMLKEKEQQLRVHCELLDERIAAHKAEIRDRDRIIGENERTIYDLKRDNQELEKFKFVLDFQIRELKRQIEPRENEISDMKENVTKIDGELEEFHKENSTIKQEIKSIQDAIMRKQEQIGRARQVERVTIQHFNAAIRQLTGIAQNFIQQPKELTKRMKNLAESLGEQHFDNKREEIASAPANSGSASSDSSVSSVDGEFRRQREYLESSAAVLRSRLTREMKSRKSENIRIMQENVALIKEINKMRREIKLIKQVQRQKELHSTVQTNKKYNESSGDRNQLSMTGDFNSSASTAAGAGSAVVDPLEAEKIVSMQKTQIQNLRLAIEETKEKINLARKKK